MARHYDQKRGLLGAQMQGFVAEPEKSRCSDPLDIAAFRRKGEVKIEHPLSTVTPFELKPAQHVDNLASHRVPMRGEQTRGLHGQRRAARNDMTPGRELKSGTQKRERIDPRMDPEAPIFHLQQQGEIAWIDRFALRCKTPCAIRLTRPSSSSPRISCMSSACCSARRISGGKSRSAAQRPPERQSAATETPPSARRHDRLRRECIGWFGALIVAR